jgi:hypothetical protein
MFLLARLSPGGGTGQVANGLNGGTLDRVELATKLGGFVGGVVVVGGRHDKELFVFSVKVVKMSCGEDQVVNEPTPSLYTGHPGSTTASSPGSRDMTMLRPTIGILAPNDAKMTTLRTPWTRNISKEVDAVWRCWVSMSGWLSKSCRHIESLLCSFLYH